MREANPIEKYVGGFIAKSGGINKIDEFLRGLQMLHRLADEQGAQVYQGYLERVSLSSAGSRELIALTMLGCLLCDLVACKGDTDDGTESQDSQ